MEHFSESLIKMITEYCSVESYMLTVVIGERTHVVGIFKSESDAIDCGDDTETKLYECDYTEYMYMRSIPWKNKLEIDIERAFAYKYITKITIGKPDFPYIEGCNDPDWWKGKVCSCD